MMCKWKIIHIMPATQLSKFVYFEKGLDSPNLPNSSDNDLAIKLKVPPYWVCFFLRRYTT